jgi:hypothetical protein
MLERVKGIEPSFQIAKNSPLHAVNQRMAPNWGQPETLELKNDLIFAQYLGLNSVRPRSQFFSDPKLTPRKDAAIF